MAKIDLSKIAERMARKTPLWAPEPPRSSAPQDRPTTDRDISQLRELLFGALVRGCEREIARVETRIATEASKLRTELGAVARRLESRITQLDECTLTGQTDLRRQILSQTHLLNDALQERSEQALRVMQQGLHELQVKKVDHAAFSTFLERLTVHLDRHVIMPDSQESSSHPVRQA